MPPRSCASLRHAGGWKRPSYSTLPALVGLVVVLGACAPAGKPDVSPPPVVVTDDAHGSTQVLRSGQVLEVRLPGNPVAKQCKLSVPPRGKHQPFQEFSEGG